MRGFIAGLLTVASWSTVGEAVARAQTPSEEHQWLHRLTGDWVAATEARLGPDTEPVRSESSEHIRSMGNWIVSEGSGMADGQPFTSVFTIGYDPEQSAFVATYVDSVQARMWTYTGSLDPTGAVLTLEADGPGVDGPGTLSRYRVTIEVPSDAHKVSTSSVQMPDGSWFAFVTSDARRQDEPSQPRR